MTECNQQTFGFQALGSRRVEADFSGGHLSSDGGALLLRETDRRLGLCDRLARCFSDTRDGRFVEHSLPVMIRQRVLGLALGYEDLNDHEQLRTDPLLAAACENPDLLGETRRHGQDRGKALAGKSTLNRLELGAVAKSGGKYRKIKAGADSIRDLLLDEGVKAIPRESRVIVLDFDATDDPIHGNQEGRFFHGYYRNYCYLPLYCARGDMENRIKEQQLDLFADRTSTAPMAGNQLRLWFSTFAYLLVARLRGIALRGTVLAKATAGTIRLRLFKVAAMVVVSVRRVHVRMAGAFPLQDVFRQACGRLRT